MADMEGDGRRRCRSFSTVVIKQIHVWEWNHVGFWREQTGVLFANDFFGTLYKKCSQINKEINKIKQVYKTLNDAN